MTNERQETRDKRWETRRKGTGDRGWWREPEDCEIYYYVYLLFNNDFFKRSRDQWAQMLANLFNGSYCFGLTVCNYTCMSIYSYVHSWAHFR